ncbi:hypothetical protein OIO90_001695 [Microbotryomycetes sp. JL221]|nr:hypothetical protein OIO90_001695 [Microbotryomycetes sp. JL221]
MTSRDTGSSRWANPSRSTAAANASMNEPTGWRPSNKRSPAAASSSTSIASQGGLRKARADIGRKPEAMDMLLSPSRGIAPEDSASSLLNWQVQDQFRQHVQSKWDKVDQQWPQRPFEPVSAKRKQELDIVLLEFRKLREGLTSSRRQDMFAAEVYESSATCAIQAENWQQLGTCLPHLVHVLHPMLLQNKPRSPQASNADLANVTTSFANLSVYTTSASHRAAQQRFISLYLLNVLMHDPAPFVTYHDTIASLSRSSLLDSDSTNIQLVNAVYRCMLQSNYYRLARVLDRLSDFDVEQKVENKARQEQPLVVDDWETSSLVDESRQDIIRSSQTVNHELLITIKPDQLQHRLISSCIPRIRQQTFDVLMRVYKLKSDFNSDRSWIDRCLMLNNGCTEEQKRDWQMKLASTG